MGLTVSTFRLVALVAAALATTGSNAAYAETAPPPLAQAQIATPEALAPQSYRLWPGRAPGATDDSVAQTPTITVYRPFPGKGNGTAVVIAPGGGYIMLASTLEGRDPAAWFASRGVTAFVLTYRVGKAARLPLVLEDGARAIRFVRAHAADFDIDPNRIGMMGFSAGGHLAASTAVDMLGKQTPHDSIDRVSDRPDFLILAYPWLEGSKLRADGGSSYCDFAKARKIACNPADYEKFMPVDFVTSKTPPTFIYHTTADGLVPVSGSTRFYDALVKAGVGAEFHAFEKGDHGTGLGGSNPSLTEWMILLDHWLHLNGLIGAEKIAPKAPRK